MSPHNKKFLYIGFGVLIAFVILGFLFWQGKRSETRPEEGLIAIVNGEKIYRQEYEDAQKIISWSENITESTQLKKAALDHVIEKRLFAKEAQRQGLDKAEELNNLFSERVEGSVNFFGGKENLVDYLKISDFKNYEDYLRNIIYKNYFEENGIWWKDVNFLSIRFSWNVPMTPEEIAYQKVAAEKIEEYYQKVKEGGFTFQEAVMQRCQDPEINYRPMGEGKKVIIYRPNDETLLQPDIALGSCLEQGLNIRVTKENPGWLDPRFLEEIQKLGKNELSNIFPLKTAEGDEFAYIFVQVIDESPFPYSSLEELIEKLKKEAKIKIYEKID